MNMVKQWNRLPTEIVDAPCLEVLKARLDRALSWSRGRCPCPQQGIWN